MTSPDDLTASLLAFQRQRDEQELAHRHWVITVETQAEVYRERAAQLIVEAVVELRNATPLLDDLDREQLRTVAGHLIRMLALVAGREHGHLPADITLDELVRGLAADIPPMPDDVEPPA